LLELSFVSLSDGQHLWRKVIDRFQAEGVTLWSFKPVISGQSQGRSLEIDGVFYRNS
jgi:hypothetical protein